jgi:hypothetical protein
MYLNVYVPQLQRIGGVVSYIPRIVRANKSYLAHRGAAWTG